ncbi:MAG TPA: D-tyrosyl-tRNA(Tyr) deacylase [Candidatus Ventrousia excrementavium]|uniref:D-aminoacyl-tRNA deacylase n=1 Tax=Candidatus Ventrousia excrementavium TaxID=2840961 RepID=A0A9D1S1C9_9CLOT|nr:D-tyrosyl-tRNA(Tyr) deacylase [Candidatus Ventrousia excrementavium]
MRAVVVRVSRASLTADGESRGEMGKGLLVLLGVGGEDTRREATYLAEKCAALRIFEDENGKMNKSLADIGGSMMVVSNFTLYADCSRGRRPDFFHAAKPDVAIPLYEFFISEIERLQVPCITGVFGADMKIDHVNDGPVTLIMDTDQMLNRQGGAKQ